MKRLHYALLSLALAATPSVADIAYEQLPINGGAVFEQLRLEYYVGLIHVEMPTRDVGQLLAMPGPKRMSMRITAERWPAMRFAQQWNQLILINNDSKTLNANLMDMLAFTSFIKDELVQGDELAVDLDEEGRTIVSLNGTQMIRTRNSALFELLLNTWIGPRPPSSDFKRNMAAMASGDPLSELLARYESLRPTAERVAATASWSTLAPEPAPAAEQLAQESQPEEIRVTAAAAIPAALATVEEATPAPVSTPSVAPESSAAPAAMPAPAPASAAPAPAQPASSDQPLREETPPADPATPAPVERAESQLLAFAGDIADVAPPAAPPIDLQAALENYNRGLHRTVYQHVEYPRRAVSRGIEGLVVMRAVISRDGDLLSVETLQSAEPLLDRAALNAVREAAPFAPIDGLPDDSQDFLIPVIFKLTQ